MASAVLDTATFVVVGCGSIGKRHISNLRACGIERIVGIDPDPSARAAVEADFGTRTDERYEPEKLQEGDVVLVTAPSSLHARIGEAAAERRCHVFVEKPLATDVADGEALVEAARRNDVVGMTGSNWKFHRSFMRMKEVIASGALGRLVYARADFGSYLPDWHPWEDHRTGYSAKAELGGGVLLDSHEFDYLRWMLGEPRAVSCLTSRVAELEIETEALAVCTVQFEGSLEAQVYLSYAERPYRKECLFVGSEGTLSWSFDRRSVRLFDAGTKRWSTWAEPDDYDLNQMYLAQTAHFLSAVETGARPETTLADGLAVLRVIDAARSSSSHGGCIVELMPGTARST